MAPWRITNMDYPHRNSRWNRIKIQSLEQKTIKPRIIFIFHISHFNFHISTRMIYLQLFITFFKIGLFGFGGGAAMLSLIQFEVVEHYGWITVSEFTNMVAVSQVTPGPIGINCATYAGYLATGSILGSAVATISLVLPSFIIMMLLIVFMTKMKNNKIVDSVMSLLRPTVVGLIAAAALLLITEETFGVGYRDWTAWLIFIGAFIATKWLKLSPILMILSAAIIGLIIY